MMRTKNKIIRAVTVSMSCVFFDEIMKKMRSFGYEMIALSSSGPELEKLRDDGFRCIDVEMERHISIAKDIKSLIRLIRVFRKERPYVVHSMTPKAGLLCMIAARLTRVPVRIHTFTGLVWPTATGLSRKVLMVTDWLTCACATNVIPEGQGVMNDLKNFGITKKPMRVLGYGNVKGVDLSYFNPERFVDIEKDKNVFSFLFVGRIVGDKGINELVEAFSKLQQKYPNIKLVLVGKYEVSLDPLNPATLQIIETNSSIIARGSKYGDDLLKEYVEADCFIMPSYREGFPNTVIEAGAMGLPSIVTDINGSREIIVNGENGLIVPPHTVQPLYDAMERMVCNDEICEYMRMKSRPMIESRFEKGFVQKCLIDFYEEILK